MFGATHREKSRMKSLGIRKHLFVERGIKQEHDFLTAVFNRGDRTMSRVKPADPIQQITREIAEIEMRDSSLVASRRCIAPRFLRVVQRGEYGGVVHANTNSIANTGMNAPATDARRLCAAGRIAQALPARA